MDAVIGLKVSQYASAAGVVRAVEQALMGVTHREVALPTGENCALIFVIQALPYAVGVHGDIWSPNYPTRDQAVALCQEHAPVQIEVV